MSPKRPLPVVVIVGRPNVGKSTLFNRLVGRRLALVDDQPGVTRDRREAEASLLGLDFKVIDTAGFETEAEPTLPGRMRAQTQAAVRAADVALFLIDGRAGLTPLDREIADWLRGLDTPILVAANKAEGRAGEAGRLEAYELGLGDPFALSAEHGEGIVDLFDGLREYLEKDRDAAQEDPEAGPEGPELEHVEVDPDGEEVVVETLGPLKLAIVGRPNAGKSTLVNQMIGEERMITGPEAGITRDAIHLDWAWQGREVQLVDTAGLRKKAKVDDRLEKMSSVDTKRAIDRAEVVCLLLDATRGLEAQDLRIADQVLQEGRALVIGLNKWDVADNPSALYNGIRGALDEGLAQVKGVPLIAVSAKTGKGIDQLMQAAFELRDKWASRVPTGLLNRWFDDAIDAHPPPAPKGIRIKLRYITQAKSRPPAFVLFGTRVDKLPTSYHRYLINSLRRDMDLGPIPIRLITRAPKNPFHRK
ncbi:ribosome biogenesis GTPase Der [Sphingomicrobium astaxanthinifaciens]|uniref:ribosome biogenesis GTPase Der n=1 Tax=Sphingomicrobium astaxanthinifaciens TaxID=1227949 RepID=UPI001FCC5EBF|nr:ribosome biogenesis GTPase Der [Sphingomicrobium astaxanthinifaciens]MCJ7421620.1 ribosome biogenesis GTPase Der [Sphingomicrobium astaxanthinifaciens]